MARQIIVNGEQRVQLTLQSNFPADMAIEAYPQKPILIAVDDVVDGNVHLELSCEDFIVVNTLNEAKQYDAPYYADIESQHYSRLVLDAVPGAAWVVQLAEHTTLDDFLTLSTQPIVVRFFQKDDGWNIMMCAHKAFRFHRCKAQDAFTAKDDAVPEHLLRMMELVDEPLSKTLDGVNLQIKRAHALFKLLKSYGRNKLTLRAREELQLNIEEVKDFLSKTEQAKNDLPEHREYEHFFHIELMNALRQQMGSKPLEKFIKRIESQAKLALKRSKNRFAASGQGDAIEAIWHAFANEEGYDLVRSLYQRDLGDTLPLHACSKCGSGNVGFRAMKVSQGKVRFKFFCRDCNHGLPRDKCSERFVSSLAWWNRENPCPTLGRVLLAYLNMPAGDTGDTKVFSSKLLAAESLTDVLVAEFKQCQIEDKAVVDKVIEQIRNVKDVFLLVRFGLKTLAAQPDTAFSHADNHHLVKPLADRP